MNMGSRPRYIIQYSGTDIPGLLHATSKCLKKCRFNIEDVSMASGSGLHSTFLTCQRDESDDQSGDPYTNTRRDEVYLREAIECALKCRYTTYYKERNEINKEELNVVVRLVSDESWRLQFCLDLEFEDRMGFLSEVTFRLQPCFTLDDASVRPAWLGGKVAPDRKRSILLIRFSPRNEGKCASAKSVGVCYDCVRRNQNFPYLKQIKNVFSSPGEGIKDQIKDILEKIYYNIIEDLEEIKLQEHMRDINFHPLSAYAVYEWGDTLKAVVPLSGSRSTVSGLAPAAAPIGST
jgi:hypothetical protein